MQSSSVGHAEAVLASNLAAQQDPVDFIELSFDERCELLEEAIVKHPLHREILYKTLAFCKEVRSLESIEAEISSYPEFKQATQNQYHLIVSLEKAGGLNRIELNAAGEAIDEAYRTMLSKEAHEGLVHYVAFITTDEGRAIVDQHAPLARLKELFALNPERAKSYCNLLAFCKEQPRSYQEVEDLLKDSPVLLRDEEGIQQPMQPSVLIDDLERAGGIVWEKGWRLTREGESIQRETADRVQE